MGVRRQRLEAVTPCGIGIPIGAGLHRSRTVSLQLPAATCWRGLRQPRESRWAVHTRPDSVTGAGVSSIHWHLVTIQFPTIPNNTAIAMAWAEIDRRLRQRDHLSRTSPVLRRHRAAYACRQYHATTEAAHLGAGRQLRLRGRADLGRQRGTVLPPVACEQRRNCTSRAACSTRPWAAQCGLAQYISTESTAGLARRCVDYLDAANPNAVLLGVDPSGRGWRLGC